jgi:hypothetical protein
VETYGTAVPTLAAQLRAAQGLPPTVKDPATLELLRALLLNLPPIGGTE